MTIGSPILAFMAGVLSILSPCVLPILPIVLGTAASRHRQGPLALAAGLSVSFVAIGLFLATVGHTIGLDADRLRYFAASLIMIVGVVLLVPLLQARIAVAAGPLGNWADSNFAGSRTKGLAGQFWIGVSWVPCGARAWGRRSGPHRCLPRRAKISVRLRLRCLLSVSARRFRCWDWDGSQRDNGRLARRPVIGR